MRTILERAPDLDDWECYAYRLAEDLESTQLTVEGRTGRNIVDSRVRASLGEFHRINIEFASPTIIDREDPVRSECGFHLHRNTLG